MDSHKLPFPEFYERVGITEAEAKNGLTNSEAEKRNNE